MVCPSFLRYPRMKGVQAGLPSKRKRVWLPRNRASKKSNVRKNPKSRHGWQMFVKVTLLDLFVLLSCKLQSMPMDGEWLLCVSSQVSERGKVLAFSGLVFNAASPALHSLPALPAVFCGCSQLKNVDVGVGNGAKQQSQHPRHSETCELIFLSLPLSVGEKPNGKRCCLHSSCCVADVWQWC